MQRKHAAVSVASSGVNAVIAAVEGKEINVVNLVLHAAGAVTVTVEDTDGNDLTGAMTLGTSVAFNSSVDPAGHFRTPVGKGIQLNLGGAVQVSGFITYLEA